VQATTHIAWTLVGQTADLAILETASEQRDVTAPDIDIGTTISLAYKRDYLNPKIGSHAL